MDSKTGGAAFPSGQVDVSEVGYGGGPCVTQEPGMTLLDYFAGQALAGQLAANPDMPPNTSGDDAREVVSINAYLYAEAMLRERARRGGEA